MPTIAPLAIASRQASSRSFLNGRAPLLGGFLEGGGGHGGAVNTVAARLGAHVEDGIAHTLRSSAKDAVLVHRSDRHHIHERITGVFRREPHFPTQVGNTEAVAVPADTRDHALDEAPGLRLGGIAKAQRIQDGDRARPHREDVA
jgi:hypothetical protein